MCCVNTKLLKSFYSLRPSDVYIQCWADTQHCCSGNKAPLVVGQRLPGYWGFIKYKKICVSRLTIIGSDNGLSPGRRQGVIWTNAGILLFGPLGTNFSEILIKIYAFSFRKIHLKMSGKMASMLSRPQCVDKGVHLTHTLEWLHILCSPACPDPGTVWLRGRLWLWLSRHRCLPDTLGPHHVAGCRWCPGSEMGCAGIRIRWEKTNISCAWLGIDKTIFPCSFSFPIF